MTGTGARAPEHVKPHHVPFCHADYNAAAAEDGLIAKVETIPKGEQGQQQGWGMSSAPDPHRRLTSVSPVTDMTYHQATILLLTST